MARINLGHVKGTGIGSITEYYGLSENNTIQPSTWSTTCPLMTSVNKYLWSYLVISWDDNSEDVELGKKIIGVYGDHGTVWNYGTTITGTSTNPTVFTNSGINFAVSGDAYVNTDNWNVYECVTGGDSNTATWRYLNNIKGATGDNGISGIAYSNDEPTTLIDGMTWIGAK